MKYPMMKRCLRLFFSLLIFQSAIAAADQLPPPVPAPPVPGRISFVAKQATGYDHLDGQHITLDSCSYFAQPDQYDTSKMDVGMGSDDTWSDIANDVMIPKADFPLREGYRTDSGTGLVITYLNGVLTQTITEKGDGFGGQAEKKVMQLTVSPDLKTISHAHFEDALGGLFGLSTVQMLDCSF